MATVIVLTGVDTEVARIHITNAEGPWTDGGETLSEIAEAINRALDDEGDEA